MIVFVRMTGALRTAALFTFFTFCALEGLYFLFRCAFARSVPAGWVTFFHSGFAINEADNRRQTKMRRILIILSVQCAENLRTICKLKIT